MKWVQIIVISVMAGAVAAGLTWFGWSLCQNLRVVARKAAARRKAKAKAKPEAAAKKKREAPEAEEGSEAEGQR